MKKQEFITEASLYQTSINYQFMVARASSREQRVIPQMMASCKCYKLVSTGETICECNPYWERELYGDIVVSEKQYVR